MTDSSDDDAPNTNEPQDVASALASASSPNAHNCHIPFELISKIISCVVGDGLRLTEAANHGVQIKTTLSLLLAGKSTNEETQRQIFKQPLHFYVTSEQHCPCGRYSYSRVECRYMCQKKQRPNFFSMNLQVQRWPEVVVHFLPDTAIRKDFHRAKDLIASSSRTLMEGLLWRYVLTESFHTKRLSRPFPNFKFVFELPTTNLHTSGSEGQVPLWTVHMVDKIMRPWEQWFNKFPNRHRIEWPNTMSAAIILEDTAIEVGGPLEKPESFPQSLRKHLSNADMEEFWPNYSNPVLQWLIDTGEEGMLSEWYLNPNPLVKLPANELAEKLYVIVISLPNNNFDSNAEVPWTAQFYEYDSRSPSSPSPSPGSA